MEFWFEYCNVDHCLKFMVLFCMYWSPVLLLSYFLVIVVYFGFGHQRF